MAIVSQRVQSISPLYGEVEGASPEDTDHFKGRE